MLHPTQELEPPANPVRFKTELTDDQVETLKQAVETFFEAQKKISDAFDQVVVADPRHDSEQGDDEMTFYPDILVVDNGPELRGRALDGWADDHGVQRYFIEPFVGKTAPHAVF